MDKGTQVSPKVQILASQFATRVYLKDPKGRAYLGARETECSSSPSSPWRKHTKEQKGCLCAFSDSQHENLHTSGIWKDSIFFTFTEPVSCCPPRQQRGIRHYCVKGSCCPVLYMLKERTQKAMQSSFKRLFQGQTSQPDGRRVLLPSFTERDPALPCLIQENCISPDLSMPFMFLKFLFQKLFPISHLLFQKQQLEIDKWHQVSVWLLLQLSSSSNPCPNLSN